MNHLSRSLQLSENGNHFSPYNKPISELDLKTFSSNEEKMQKARCGLDFMQKSLRLINPQQIKLHESLNLILKELELTKHCVASHIGNCTIIPEPDFQSKETYKRKQWGHTVLKISVDFLDELVKIPHTSRKLPPPKHAWQRNAFHPYYLSTAFIHLWKFVTSSWSDPVITWFACSHVNFYQQILIFICNVYIFLHFSKCCFESEIFLLFNKKYL